MRILKPQCLGVMHAALETQTTSQLIVTGLLAFGLDAPSKFFSEQDMWQAVQAEMPPGDVLDLWMPKPCGEVLMWGSAMALHPVTQMPLALHCGPVLKRLLVHGDRHWEPGPLGWRISQATPFTTMPMHWERSFGGPDFAACPVGTGFDSARRLDRAEIVALPNIEAFQQPMLSPGQSMAPAGFGPSDPRWPSSAPRGTFDQAWLARQSPGLPDDFDWRVYNRAQADQRLRGFWRGDEALMIEGMHANQPRLESALPGVQLRCFSTRVVQDEIQEWPMQLDTVCLFPAAMMGIVLFRTIVPDAGTDGRALHSLMLAAEWQHRPKSLPEYARAYRLRTDEASKMDYALDDGQLMPELTSAQQNDRAQAAQMLRSAQQQQAAARERSRISQAAAALAVPAAASPLKVRAVDVPAELAAFPAMADHDMAFDDANLTATPDAIVALSAALDAGIDMPVAQILGAWLKQQEGGSDTPDMAEALAGLPGDPAARAELAASLRAMALAMREGVAKVDSMPMDDELDAVSSDALYSAGMQAAIDSKSIPGLLDVLPEQISGMSATALAELKALLPNLPATPIDAQDKAQMAVHLSSLLAPEAVTLQNVHGMMARLAGQTGAASPLMDALEKSHALAFNTADGVVGPGLFSAIEKMPPEMTAALSMLAAPDAADVQAEVLVDAALGDMYARVAKGEQMDLASLMHLFDGAPQAQAQAVPAAPPTEGKVLEDILQAAEQDPDATPASLSESLAGDDMESARHQARGRPLQEPGLSAAAALALGLAMRAEHDRGASLQRRDLAGIDWSGADLRGIDLRGALLERADLRGADLRGALCAQAVLIGAQLQHARFTDADLSGANVSGAQAQHSSWDGANLSGVILSEGDFSHASMRRVRLGRCQALQAQMQHVDLSESLCQGGDWMQANLSGALLHDARWQQTSLLEAQLSGCQAQRATLIDCMLASAEGEGVDFSNACLTDSNLVHTRLPGLRAPGLDAAHSSWQGSDLSGAIFDHAVLAHAIFLEAQLNGASFASAQLSQAFLSGAQMARAVFSDAQLFEAALRGVQAIGADFCGANLYGADLSGAMLDQCDLTGANLQHGLLATPTDA